MRLRSGPELKTSVSLLGSLAGPTADARSRQGNGPQSPARRELTDPHGTASRGVWKLDHVIELSASDLPACCPSSVMLSWSWHPRVFLDVLNQPLATCPYCGMRYRIAERARKSKLPHPALHQHRQWPHVVLKTAGDRTPPALERVGTGNLWADGRGNTTLELITKWVRRRDHE